MFPKKKDISLIIQKKYFHTYSLVNLIFRK